MWPTVPRLVFTINSGGPFVPLPPKGLVFPMAAPLAIPLARGAAARHPFTLSERDGAAALSPQSAARSPQPEGSFCRAMEGLEAFSRPELRVAGSSDENTKLRTRASLSQRTSGEREPVARGALMPQSAKSTGKMPPRAAVLFFCVVAGSRAAALSCSFRCSNRRSCSLLSSWSMSPWQKRPVWYLQAEKGRQYRGVWYPFRPTCAV